MIDKFWLGLTLVVGLTWGAPNIVMITVEDLGWGDVSWNNPEVIMPNIATLASSGVILGHIIFSSRHENLNLCLQMPHTCNHQVGLHKLPCSRENILQGRKEKKII